MLPVQAQHLESIKRILRDNAGKLISIELANEEQDTKEATDLIVRADVGTIAVRIRTYRSTLIRGECVRDFTVRSRTRYNGRTEIDKLRDGFAKWYLYAWESEDGRSLAEYVLVDMDMVRDAGLLDRAWQEISNGDGTAFIPIPLWALKHAGCLVAIQVEQDIPLVFC